MNRTSRRGGERPPKRKRDIEKTCSKARFVATLRRLADALEADARLRVQVAGERVSIPPDAIFSIEHEREGAAEEVEIQLKWENR